jgi:limonene-1,2-epoxide hydrolase
MSERQEAVVRSLLDSLVAGDRDAALEHFSDDATYNVSAWQEPIRGSDAIRADLERQAGIFSNFRYQILNIVSTDSVVFTERLDSIDIGGEEIQLHWASVHEIGTDGRVRAARDYYDMKELEAQLA